MGRRRLGLLVGLRLVRTANSRGFFFRGGEDAGTAVGSTNSGNEGEGNLEDEAEADGGITKVERCFSSKACHSSWSTRRSAYRYQ